MCAHRSDPSPPDHPPSPGVPRRAPQARDRAIQCIALQAEAFPRPTLAPPAVADLDPLDQRLAHAIHDAVLRRWLTLRALLHPLIGQGFDTLQPPLRAALLVGSAQLTLLHRIPSHAAIDHAVGWSHRSVGRGAAGLVNAVLRRLAPLVGEALEGPWSGQRDAIPLGARTIRQLAQPMLPAKRSERWAIATGLARPVLEALEAQLGREACERVALHSIEPAPTILRLGPAHDPQQLPPDLAAALLPHERPGHHAFQGQRAHLERILDLLPTARAQDPASSASLELLAPALPACAPSTIVDLCAGRGTKTLQLAAMFPTATILASDTDPRRLHELQSLLAARPTLSSRVHAVEQHQLTPGCADLVLLDVPCSNSAVLARRPEARWRADPRELDRLVDLQRQILRLGSSLLRRDGPHPPALVYATCSLLHAENTSQAHWAQAELGLRTIAQHALLPQRVAESDQGPTTYHDGSFAAVLVPA